MNNKILHSTIKGKGIPLLIIHGYFGMSDNWKSLGNKFSNYCEVHLIDQRNHGRSFHSDEFFYELLAEDINNYINYHKLKKVYIIGHSMGGKVAMFFAVKYAELVDKFVVVDISPKFYKPHHSTILEGLNSIDFNLQNTRALVDKKMSELIHEVGIRQFLLKNVYRKNKDQLGYRFNLKSLTENNNKIGKALPTDAFYNKKVLFIKGSNSDYITERDELEIKIPFPNAKIIEIKNAGHWVHAENPKEFFREVTAFLELV